MIPTSLSLLDRLRAAGPDHPDWLRLHDLYRPLIVHWIGRVPGLADDRGDVVQEVLLVLVREIPKFDRRREGSFRAWLRRVAVNQIRSHRRRQRRRPIVGLDPAERFLEQWADPQDDLTREWDRDHDLRVFEKLLAIVGPDFSPATWEAFRRFALDGLPAARVAEELGLTENAVIHAKSRILKRLRLEAGELLG